MSAAATKDRVCVFPLTADKRPAVKSWKGYDGPRPLTRLVGVQVPYWIAVIDLDLYKDASRDRVDAALGCALDWDSALIQTTPRGGEHYAFVVPEGFSIPTAVDLFGIKGFDTRAQGNGYIATGEGYHDCSMIGIVPLFEGPGRYMLPELPAEACRALGRGVDDFGDTDDNGLLRLVAAQRIGLSIDQIREYVARLTAEDAGDSDRWFRTMRGIWHETDGSAEGWQIFDEFSQRCPEKYDRAANRKRWESFAKRPHPRPITFASVIQMAGGQMGDVATTDGGDPAELDWLERAAHVETVEQWQAFKREFVAVRPTKDLIGLVASEIARCFGKAHQMPRAEFKQALTPEKPKKKTRNAEDVAGFEWCASWCFLEMRNEFCHADLPHYRMGAAAFNAKFARDLPEGLDMRPAEAAVKLGGIPCYADLLYWPGAGEVVEYRGLSMLNTYRADGVEPCAADDLTFEDEQAIRRVQRHFEMLFCDPRERGILLDWLFWVARFPGRRVSWMPVIQGPQGCGKTFIGRLLQLAVGHNMRQIDPGAIGGRFNGWAADSVVNVIEEIRVSGTSKFEIMDKLKPLITNNEIGIEEKGRDQRTVPNHASYLSFTNHMDAIPIDGHDRRYCMLATTPRTPGHVVQAIADLCFGETPAEYFGALFETLDGHAPALVHWLTTAPISAEFKANGVAPVTAWRETAILLGRSTDTETLMDAIDRHRCDVINDRVIDITHLQKLCAAEYDAEPLPKTKALSRALLDLGYSPLSGSAEGKLKISPSEGAHRIWSKEDVDAASIRSFFKQ